MVSKLIRRNIEHVSSVPRCGYKCGLKKETRSSEGIRRTEWWSARTPLESTTAPWAAVEDASQGSRNELKSVTGLGHSSSTQIGAHARVSNSRRRRRNRTRAECHKRQQRMCLV
ncbi:hypothetical protein EVAR_2549_1 [Eumeta japonica]|uniref:Uncharacterized protein n=1 Tax=Eumeta variegata TaxID=151549 RepID=A0A4C1SPE9_EUMVA|nr:hypothetical protein EVAR_2549_1 [Eumeta japonica]